jgi:peroxiredoxin
MGRGTPGPLETGATAPAVSLADAAGARSSLDSLLSAGPVLLAFFKVSCPVCQLTLPFLDRLAGGNVQIIPVSQDDAAATARFAREFGVHVPMLFDREEDGYPASNAFGLTTVPSVFLIEQDRRISWDLVGFSKTQLERLAARIGRPIFTAADMVPALKAG